MSEETKNEMSEQLRGGMLPTVTKDFSEKSRINLMTTKIDLVRIFPFFSFLIMSTEYYFTKALPTMAATTVGGNKIYVNEEFLNGMNRKERAFVIAHEMLHIFLEHIGRQTDNNYHHELWNVATDFCINSHLKELSESRVAMPSIGLYDKRFKKMSADQIYHILLKENKNDPKKAAAKYGSAGDPNEDGQCPYDALSRESMTDAQRTENRQKIASAMGQNDMEKVKSMGEGYADLIRQFEDLLDSKIPWQTVLREFIVQTSKNRYTYNRPSRKSYHSRIIFPTMTGDNIDLVFGVDTSGSMSNTDLAEALTELHSICEEFDNWNVDLISCDTYSHLIGEYNSEEGDDFANIDTDLVGGGGTEMSPMVEFANDKEEAPAVCIIITDGYIPEQTLDDAVEDVPVIVIVTSAGNQDLKLEQCEVLFMNEKEDVS